MTRKRGDSHSTEFGLWLREQPEIDSGLGYITTNVDYLWENYQTHQWFLLEEKRYCSKPQFSQERQFIKLDKAIADRNYLGFYVLIFENTTPDDGRMWLYGLNGRIKYHEINRDELIGFLRDFKIKTL